MTRASAARRQIQKAAIVQAAQRRARPEESVQAQKSAATRKSLIEAAIRCLIKYGYANTTTPRVAAEAGLSRGAMMHHFENGAAVTQAAISYLHDKRLRAFHRAVASLPAGEDHLHSALQAYWRQCTHPMFAAFHELAVAARTDPALAAMLQPARQEFRRQWYLLAVDLFPEWSADRASFDLALALTQNTLEGMAINRLSDGDDPVLTERLLGYLEAQLRALRPPR
jgi:AcrR family transcriptional regulator